jgi:hypothetical protein
MAFRVQVRRDTGQRWSLNNPILLNGEMGFNIDTSQFKIGDGTTPWNSLSYWSGGIGPVGPTGPIGLIGPTGPAGQTGPTGPVGYQVYIALLNQVGIIAPVATVLQNTIGNIVWSYSSAGNYVATLAGAFPSDKVVMFLNNTRVNSICSIQRSNDNALLLQIVITDSLPFLFADSLLNNASLEIRVYP